MAVEKHVAIVGGCGASGGLLAVLLKRQGYKVTIIDDNKAAVQAIRDNQGKVHVEFPKSPGDGFEVQFDPDEIRTWEDINADNFRKPTYVISTVPSFVKDGRLGRQIASIASGAPVLDLGNGLKGHPLAETEYEAVLKEAGILVQGFLNHPAKREDATTVLGLTSLEHIQDSGIELGNDYTIPVGAMYGLQSDFTEAGIGCTCRRSTLVAAVNKLFSVMSMGFQAALGTSFGDASDESTLTGRLAIGAMRELWQVASKLGVHQSLNDGDRDGYIGAVKTTLGRKGASKGSMAMAVNAGKNIEHGAIYGYAISIAEQAGIEVPYLKLAYHLAESVQICAQEVGTHAIESYRARVETELAEWSPEQGIEGVIPDPLVQPELAAIAAVEPQFDPTVGVGAKVQK